MKYFYIIVIFIGVVFISKAQNVDGFLKTKGTKITNNSNDDFIIRGIGIGGWMLQEGYMFNLKVAAQHEIRTMLRNLTDKTTTDAFYDAWLNYFFTADDVKLISEWGFNTIRIPLHYNLFTLPVKDEPVTGQNTWLTKGFTMVDSLLSWCEDNDIYLILDIHAAPGGQGKDAGISDYDSTKPSLWESEQNRNKLIALWGKLADRYKDKKYIGGYDLLNETNWNFEGSNDDGGCGCKKNIPLKNLYKSIIDEIRKVDNNHIVFIEGNCWANNFNGLEELASYDSNIAYSFHKYWNFNSDDTIRWLLNLRTQTNIPLFLGETGENSNSWLTDMVKLMEKHHIGWATWAYKQIDIDDPFTILSDKWKKISDYDPKKGTNKPTSQQAREGMNELLNNIKTANCKFNPGVVYALNGLPFGKQAKAYKEHSIPGIIFAADYDMGLLAESWYDKNYQNLNGSTGNYNSGNQGYLYRNDGIDIRKCFDDITNGYSVAWTENGEWMKYSIKNVEEGYYDITFRVAVYSGKINMRINNKIISSEHLVTPHTGGYQIWKDVVVENVFVPADTKSITVYIIKGGFNLNYVKFEPSSSSSIFNNKVSNGSIINQIYKVDNNIVVDLNRNSKYEHQLGDINVIDINGRVVASFNKYFSLNESTIVNIPVNKFPKGIYFIKVNIKGYYETYKIIL